MNAQTAELVPIADAELVPVVEAELVTIDEALIPYVSKQAELEAMIRRMSTFADVAAVITVVSPETKAYAVRMARNFREDRAEAVKFFTPIKQSIDKVKKSALDMEKLVLGLVDGPVAVLSGRVVAFDREIALEAEERRQRLLAQERQRLELAAAEAAATEAQRLVEEAEAAAMIAAHFGDDVQPVDTVAIGEAVLAATAPISEELVELAAMEAEPAQAPVKVAGFNYTTVTHVAVDDFAALVKAVAAGTVPLEALQPAESFIRTQAEKMGADLGYAGVRVWTTQDPRIRR